MKKILSLLMLLVTIVSGAWASQTDLISGITLPNLPSGTYTGGTNIVHNGSNKAVVCDAKGNSVMQASAPGYGSPVAANFTWTNANNESTDASWSTTGTTWNAASDAFVGSTPYTTANDAHYVNFARRCNLRTNRTFAYRFTNCAGVSASVKSQGNTDAAAAVMAVYEVSGTTQTPVKSISSKTNALDAITVDGLDKTKTYVAYIYGANGSNGELYEVAFIAPASAPATEPTITTQPKDATFVIGTSDYPSMSVVAEASAGELSYQWELSNDGENFKEMDVTSAVTSTLLGSEAIGLLPEQAATYYLRCKVTDSNGSVYSDVATLSIVNAVAPTISVKANKTVALKGDKKITLTATVTGTPDPTIQWYSKTGELIQAIEGATSAEFTPATTEYGTFEYLAKATNAVDVADSDPVTILVKPALQNAKFTNSVYGEYGIYGAIAEPAATGGDLIGSVEVPYTNNGETPAIDETTLKAWGDTEATITTNENTITVTSGEYTAEYVYEYIPVNPIAVTADIAETNFTKLPDWVFNKYGYDDTKGLKFAKAVDDADNLRIAKGFTRQYYFVGPAKSLTLTQVGTKRKVNVYVNGEKKISDTNNDALGDIELSPTSDNIVIVESNQTGGDGGFSAFSITACDVKPTITADPQDVEYTVGSTTYPSMSVEATATSGDMKYQWEFSTIGDAQTFQSFPSSVLSAATATLSGEEVVKAFSTKITAGTYYVRCRITDAAGTAYSKVATINIIVTPTITTQPQDVKYVIGSTTCANMSIVAEPAVATDELSYQWQFSMNNEAFYDIPTEQVPSAATATLLGSEAIGILNNLSPLPEKVFIRCIVLEPSTSSAFSNVATVSLVEPADVTEAVTWDWSNVTGSGTGSELPANQKNIDIIIADAPDFTPGTGFNADKLVMNGQYAWRDANSSKFAQANSLRFKTTVTGYVQVEFANTGNNPARTVTINGNADGQEVTNNSTYATSKKTFVEAGNVVIAGIQTATGDDQGAAKMLRIRKVTFTPGEAPVIVDDPVITPAGGQFISSVTVKGTCATTGATVLYSTDGENWTEIPAEGYAITETTSLSFKATKEGMTDSQVIPLTFTKVETTPQTTVSAATTWDWSAITASDLELKDDGTTLPSKNDDFVTYGDIADFNSATLPTAFDDNIAFKGRYPYRKASAQDGSIRLVFGVAGAIAVDFSDTGSTVPEGGAVKRYLNVNGSNTEYYTQRDGSSSDPKTGCTVDVEAGEVIITGMGEDGVTPQAICIKKIVFTPTTGINGIAEDAEDAEDANVKIIKNGKLYIGKYNIAGQLVK